MLGFSLLQLVDPLDEGAELDLYRALDFHLHYGLDGCQVRGGCSGSNGGRGVRLEGGERTELAQLFGLIARPTRREKHVTPAAISPPGVARGRFVGGQQSGLAGSKPPPLFTRGASSCSSQGRRQGEPRGASPRPSAPTYLPYLPARPTEPPNLVIKKADPLMQGVRLGPSLRQPGDGVLG